MPDRRDMLPNEEVHELMDEIPAAGAKEIGKTGKRNRKFEKEHRAFSYRLTDKEINDKIAGIADALLVPVDDVARAFVQAGINAARLGRIPLHTIPLAPKRMTLFPTGNETWEIREEASWPNEISIRKKKRRLSEFEKKQRQRELNQFRVSYRWPASIDDQLKQLVEQLIGKQKARSDGRKGWVLTILFRYSLNAYQAGLLPLEPKTVVVKQGLKW